MRHHAHPPWRQPLQRRRTEPRRRPNLVPKRHADPPNHPAPPAIPMPNTRLPAAHAETRAATATVQQAALENSHAGTKGAPVGGISPTPARTSPGNATPHATGQTGTPICSSARSINRAPSPSPDARPISPPTPTPNRAAGATASGLCASIAAAPPKHPPPRPPRQHAP